MEFNHMYFGYCNMSGKLFVLANRKGYESKSFIEKLMNSRNTSCNKWDGQTGMFGEEGLLPLWVADMDFRCPDEVIQAIEKRAAHGIFGYPSEFASKLYLIFSLFFTLQKDCDLYL